ncbi:MAG TPA: LTA synthase family protein [Gemmatimonadaceae bacterium]|nr:LTA synthase family protein [Gemmatimonadaceae bacterium]
MFFLIAMLAKVSYFNFKPGAYLDNDWYPWYREEAIHAVYGSLATLLILISPLVLLRPSTRFVAMTLESFLLSVLVLGDVLHFRFYGDIPSLSASAGAWQLALVWESVVALVARQDILLFADIVVGLALFPFYRRATRNLTGHRRERVVAAGILFGAGCALATVPIGIVRADIHGVFRYKYFRYFGARKIGVINYHVFEIAERLKHLVAARNSINSRENADALALVAQWNAHAPAHSPLFGAARGKNLVMIMVESLHAFPIGLKFEGREVMPNLTAFARRSMYFDRFFSQSADGTTSDGEFTSLQSLYPLQAGSVQTTYPTNNYRGVPRILSERGYSTMSAHAYYGELFNMRIVHPRLGFQKSYFREDFVQRDTLGLGLSDAEFFRQVIPRLEAQPKPFMAFLITLSTHHDWKLPAAFKTLNVGELEGSLLGRYLQAMNHFDEGFGVFIESLERRGLLDESVVVVYGDHKARFGKSETEGRTDLARLMTRYAQLAEPDSGFDFRYWALQNQVALLIHLPKDSAAGRKSATAGHLDIGPTVLSLLGIDNRAMMALGRDVTGGQDQFVVLRNGSFIYADTVCATPDASASTAKCRDTRTGTTLDPAMFEPRFDAARRRLSASDIIISRNLIPAR